MYKDIIGLSKKLIGFQSVWGDKDREEIVEFVKHYLKGSGLIVQEPVPGALYISYDGKKRQKLMLLGHLDVVPAGKELFKPKIRGGKLYGRGSADMKVSVAVFLDLLKEFLKEKPPVAVLLTSDEEYRGRQAAALAKKGYSAEFIFAGEQSDFQIHNQSKGLLWAKLKFFGKAAHGSKPWEGLNAVEKGILALEKIKHGLRKVGKDVSINLGNIVVSEAAFNRVPAEAEFWLDIRYLKGREKIVRLLKENSEGMETMNDFRAVETEKSNSYLQKLSALLKMEQGKAEFGLSYGASDLRFFSLPAVMFGFSTSAAHSNNEFVELKDIGKFYRIVEGMIRYAGKV